MQALKKLSVVLLLITCFGVLGGHAQKTTSATSTRPFEPLEELHFEAEFSRALVRKLDVADLTFRASRTPLNEANGAGSNESYALTFNAEVTSKGFFARLFNLKFREVVESIVEPMTFTVERTTILDEQGKRVRTTESTFDRTKGTMTWTLRDPNNPASEPRHATTEFSGAQLQDVLSAIYFIRVQPLEVGKSFDIFIGDGGRVYTIPVKVVEKKRMKTVLGRVETLRVSAELFGPERLIDENGEFSIWFTADARHIPVGGHVKTDYGTFDIKLKRVITSNPAVK